MVDGPRDIRLSVVNSCFSRLEAVDATIVNASPRAACRDISSTVKLTMSNTESALMRDCLMINDVDEMTDFSMPRDIGAVIVRKKDSTAVGLLLARSMRVAGHPGVTVACSFERVMEQLKLTLQPTQRVPASRSRGTSRTTRRRKSTSSN